MMDIAQIIKKEYVAADLTACQRDEALKELLTLNAIQENIVDGDMIFQELVKREASFTTKVMDYIAIPHAKSGDVKDAMVLVGKSEQGVVWTQDGDFASSKPEDRVKLVFMILVPGENESNEHLKILAMLSRCLVNDKFRENLIQEKDPVKVHQLIVTAVLEKMGQQ